MVPVQCHTPHQHRRTQIWLLLPGNHAKATALYLIFTSRCFAQSVGTLRLEATLARSGCRSSGSPHRRTTARPTDVLVCAERPSSWAYKVPGDLSGDVTHVHVPLAVAPLLGPAHVQRLVARPVVMPASGRFRFGPQVRYPFCKQPPPKTNLEQHRVRSPTCRPGLMNATWTGVCATAPLLLLQVVFCVLMPFVSHAYS